MCSFSIRPGGTFPCFDQSLNLEVRSLSKLVDDLVSIVATKVVEKHWDLEADRALQVTLAMGSANKPAGARDMVVVSDFRTLRFPLYELVTADVAPSGIIIFLLLAGTQALHRSICPKYRYDFRFPHDKRVKELGERFLSDFHHGPLVKVIKTRGEDRCCSTYFVLLGVGGVLNLTTGHLEDGLKVSIYDERRLCTILIVVEFYLRLFGNWRRKHMKHRHEIVSGAELLVARQNVLRRKVSKASETKVILGFVFCYICKQTGYACDWCIMLLPIE